MNACPIAIDAFDKDTEKISQQKRNERGQRTWKE